MRRTPPRPDIDLVDPAEGNTIEAWCLADHRRAEKAAKEYINTHFMLVLRGHLNEASGPSLRPIGET